MRSHMRKYRINSGLVMMLLIFGLVFACMKRPIMQPTIRSKSLEILTINGNSFKDLNKNGRLDPYEDWRLSVEKRVDDLVSQMTLPEKAGVMMHPLLAMGENGKLLEHTKVVNVGGREIVVGHPTSDVILNKHITHFNTYASSLPAAMATWNNNIQSLAEKTRLGIPVTLSSNFRHGFRSRKLLGIEEGPGYFSRWPEPIGLAATRDPMVVEEFGSIANQEYRAVGIRTALHPMATLATAPLGNGIAHTFGADANLAASMVTAYILGFQGEEISPSSVSCMTKHFPGSGILAGGWSSDSEYEQEALSAGGNLEYQLLPFQAAIRAGTAQIMPHSGIPAYVNDVDATTEFDKEIITGLLRDQLGFAGAVCTDWFFLPAGGTSGTGQTSLAERYLKALEAGVDQFGGESNPEILIELVNQEKIPEDRITISVRRLLQIKFRLGLFENPYVDPAWASQVCGNKDFQESADLAQRKSIVLLKNDSVHEKAILPLSTTTKVYVEGLDPELVQSYGTVVSSLDDADVAILRLQNSFEPGENFIKQMRQQNPPIFQEQTLEHIRQVLRTKPTVVTFFLEQPNVIPEIGADSAAFLAEFGAADEALLDVIFGKFNPTGKLPFDLLASAAVRKRQKEGLPDYADEPLFKYGHGLSY